jgi:diketogulonate reductase-like aldo/keto reductase
MSSVSTILLNDGTAVPALAFGTGTALYYRDAAKQVQNAIEAGFIHIDTAQMYGNEDSVGRGIAASGVPRERLFVTTKLNKLGWGKTVKGSLQDSLKKLKMDYVDLFLIHMPVDHSDLKKTWREMEEVKAEGLARNIGVSNFQPKHLEVILPEAKVIPAINQVRHKHKTDRLLLTNFSQIEYNPYLVKASQPVIDYCKNHNIAIAAYGGLNPVSRYTGGPVDPELKKVATRLAEEAGKTVTEAQVLQLWLRKKGIVCVTYVDFSLAGQFSLIGR